jgi:hypothetical protein
MPDPLVAFPPIDTIGSERASLADQVAECVLNDVMGLSALSTHVGTALGNEFQIGVRIESRLRRQLNLREPIHTRIPLVVRDDQHRKGKCAQKSEKGPRGPFHSLSSSLLLKSLRRCGVQDVW